MGIGRDIRWTRLTRGKGTGKARGARKDKDEVHVPPPDYSSRGCLPQCCLLAIVLSVGI